MKRFIKIHGKKVSLIKDKELASKGLLGRCLTDKCEIRYSPEQTPASVGDSILHEVLHFISFDAHLELTERQVGALATLLFGVIVENRELFNELLDGYKSIR